MPRAPRAATTVAAALALALLLSRCDSQSSSSSSSTPATDAGPTVAAGVVDPAGFSFSPTDQTVNVGDTVTWRFASSGHNVVSGTVATDGGTTCAPDGQFCSPSDANCASAGLAPAGASYRHAFTTAPGSGAPHVYFCTAHCATEKGTITVRAP
jgi:plastocyanin